MANITVYPKSEIEPRKFPNIIHHENADLEILLKN